MMNFMVGLTCVGRTRPTVTVRPTVFHMADDIPEAVMYRAFDLLGADDAKRWITETSMLLPSFIARHSFETFEWVGKGRGSFLCYAENTEGRFAAKLPYCDAAAHADAAQMLSAARVGPKYESFDRDMQAVLTRWVDGPTLNETDVDRDMVKAVGRLLYRLCEHRPDVTLEPLDVWLRRRVEGDPKDVAPGTVTPTVRQRQEASQILADVPTVETCCHADLNPGNVIVGSGGQPVLIDARGMYGNVSYDIATFISKTFDIDTQPAMRETMCVAARVDVDEARIMQYVTETARV